MAERSFDAGDLEFAGGELAVWLAVAATVGEGAAVADEHPSEDRRGALLGLGVGAAEADQPAGAVIAGGQRADVGAHVSEAAALRERAPFLGGRGAQRVLAVQGGVGAARGLAVLLDQPVGYSLA